MAGTIVVPFDALKIIDLGQAVALPVYQALYKDHSEPVGLISVVQALGLLQPSDRAVEIFNERWTKKSMRWKLHETGIEVVTGKSSTTAEMAKTRDGETVLVVLSFLLEGIDAKSTSDLTRKIVDATPPSHLSIRPRVAQINNVVSAVQSQTTCVSWTREIAHAQECVCEMPIVFTTRTLPNVAHDLPMEAMQSFYQALCIISRFPKDYHCLLTTPLSLTMAFGLAHSICGFRVCVVVDGEVVYGNAASGQWQVKLERWTEDPISTRKRTTTVRLGHKLEDPRDLLVIGELGPIRSNRVPLVGIGTATTIGQGLKPSEGEELASLAIGVAISILARWHREQPTYMHGDDDTKASSLHELALSPNDDGVLEGGPVVQVKTAPVKARVGVDTIETWWGCSPLKARELLENSKESFDTQDLPTLSWERLRFPKTIESKIEEFLVLVIEQKVDWYSRSNHLRTGQDFGRLTHMLTTQILLITFLRSSPSARQKMRVRLACPAQRSPIGNAIKNLARPRNLLHSDALYSWYFWMEAKNPKPTGTDYGLDVLTADGYLVYRSLILDLNLYSNVCEMVDVEPGHISSASQRFTEVRGYSDGYPVDNESQYREQLQPLTELRSHDRTGQLTLRWSVQEGDDVVDLKLHLDGREHGLGVISASVCQIASLSWGLQYGDRSIECTHDEDRVGVFADYEDVVAVSAGSCLMFASSPLVETLLLFCAHGNDLGQIACLLSAPPDTAGMVRTDACLRCCVTACNKRELEYLID